MEKYFFLIHIPIVNRVKRVEEILVLAIYFVITIFISLTL
ncbi:hypothetical protein Igag_0894 [Ignisphaera aggregans DSM 17230]|uniref:Uncharacterized protein n=1 Tax=Ignisphaera aggregans (strain DSM 17230 / JCM 13409 / AQ1.S1) TaxID=583356 RepID=E0STU5_IGNAA|nr:hypothetical protein Igag_0894 [Ignisphaera aggregans DSM 17230]